MRRRIPAGRFGTSAEVVEAVLFLLAGGGYTTGQVLCVDGGRALV
ncbi:MAG: SDR family oxidoreductase [Vicinamibacteria bacterium]